PAVLPWFLLKAERKPSESCHYSDRGQDKIAKCIRQIRRGEFAACLFGANRNAGPAEVGQREFDGELQVPPNYQVQRRHASVSARGRAALVRALRWPPAAVHFMCP